MYEENIYSWEAILLEEAGWRKRADSLFYTPKPDQCCSEQERQRTYLETIVISLSLS